MTASSNHQQQRFDALVHPHLDALYRTAYRFTGSSADAEDLVQDVLVKLYPRMDELERIERLRPWLLRVLHNQFVDSQRRHKRNPVALLREHSGEGHDEGLDRFPDNEGGPEEQALRQADSRRLEEALAGLWREHRAVVALHDMEGYTLAEISETLEVPVGTLKSRLHRARAHLRRMLS
jgi:RNA polymerase sigma-70 factor (ECF subfamily)